MNAQDDQDVASTWTDGLNRALAPLGLSVSGEDAANFCPALAPGALASLRAMTDADCARIAAKANAYLEIDRVTAAHIAEAVAYTLSHWSA